MFLGWHSFGLILAPRLSNTSRKFSKDSFVTPLGESQGYDFIKKSSFLPGTVSTVMGGSLNRVLSEGVEQDCAIILKTIPFPAYRGTEAKASDDILTSGTKRRCPWSRKVLIISRTALSSLSSFITEAFKPIEGLK